MDPGAQRSLLKFAVQVFLSLQSHWRYSKEKAEKAQQKQSVAENGNSQLGTYKKTSYSSKKTVAFLKIGVIFLALPWSRDYGTSIGSAQPVQSTWCRHRA